MLRTLALLALTAGGLAVAAATSKPPPGMGAPASAGWGSSTEPAPMPTAPNVPHLPWLQTLVDQAPAGSTLKLPPGTYSGPVLVNKPLVIDGGGKVVVDGGGKGTVFVLEANSSTLRGLHLKNSGASHDSDDACLNVRGDYNTIESLVISDCLFGIDLKQANENLIRGNKISSKPLSLGLRGDGLRLWYSMNNRIEDNEVIDSRDMVVWYSNGNVFSNNLGRRSRYSIHFMFANDNEVAGNRFYDNAVGVYLMYTERVNVRNNVISHATGATGMGLGFKESSDILLENNEIIYCGVGVGSDLSPFQPDTTIRFVNNRFAFNGIAIQLTSELGGNEMHGNTFEGNLTDVFQAGRGEGVKNKWNGNYFDTYQGFDRDEDGVGDTPHEDFSYADRIWMEIPNARFFKTSPVLELLDFLERLAPFSTPNLQARDEKPLYIKPERRTDGSAS